MAEHRLRRQGAVSSTNLLGHLGMPLGESLDVHFVNDGLMPRNAWRPIVAPGASRVDHRRQWGVGGAVAVIKGPIFGLVANLVTEQIVAPPNIPADGLGVRIQQDFIWIESVARLRFVRPVNPIPIELPWPNIG